MDPFSGFQMPIALTSSKKRRRSKARTSSSSATSQRSPRRSSKQEKSKLISCFTCDKNNDAEYVHPVLNIPICGTCNKSCRDARHVVDHSTGNSSECIMCGIGDGNEMYMCDKCPNSFCERCVLCIVGKKEAKRVKALKIWDCYKCDPTPAFTALTLPSDFEFYNLDTVYNNCRPPKHLTNSSQMNLYCIDDAPVSPELLSVMTESEKVFTSLFTSQAHPRYSVLNTLRIIDVYLTAQDLANLPRLNHRLRAFFDKVILTPGLFKTFYGTENSCQLFPHQIVSLRWMTAVENKITNRAFGALRGGILADAPGLGKTVTALALILSTAGVLPTEPDNIMFGKDVSDEWASRLPIQNFELIEKVLFQTVKKSEFTCFPIGLSSNYVKKWFLDGKMDKIETFERDIRSIIGIETYPDTRHAAIVKHAFKTEMNEMKIRMHKGNRAFLNTESGARWMFERNLIPSAATLIIVPMSLLEHWHEQISRHFNLDFLLHRNDPDYNSPETKRSPALNAGRRGIVYFDGLGDLLDVQAPLPRLRMNEDRKHAAELSQYLVVVTTFERCAQLQHRVSGHNSHNSHSSNDTYDSSYRPKRSSYVVEQGIAFTKIRWLRLLVDEGHELGSQFNDMDPDSVSPAVSFIRDIAAERRWVMSGTPTTGTKSSLGLAQIHRLLMFLRHPIYGTGSESYHQWKDMISSPFLQQDVGAKIRLETLLNSIMIRHTKQDLHLFDPIKKTVILDPEPLPTMDDQSSHEVDAGGKLVTKEDNLIDKIKARYIYSTIQSCMQEYLRHNNMKKRKGIYGDLSALRHKASLSPHFLQADSIRRPKAIIFSTDSQQVMGVGHFLYLWMGESGVCEHGGHNDKHIDARARQYLAESRSSELSRFRWSKKKFRICPLCGGENGIAMGDHCSKRLLLVEYLPEPDLPQPVIQQEYHQQHQPLSGTNPPITNLYNPANIGPSVPFQGHNISNNHVNDGTFTTSMPASRHVPSSVRFQFPETDTQPIAPPHSSSTSSSHHGSSSNMDAAWSSNSSSSSNSNSYQNNQNTVQGSATNQSSSTDPPYNPGIVDPVDDDFDNDPCPAGHGYNGQGGPYRGACLCNARGCTSEDIVHKRCRNYPNPFRRRSCIVHPPPPHPLLPNPSVLDQARYTAQMNAHMRADRWKYVDNEIEFHKGNRRGRNLALVAEEHIRHYVPGYEWQENEEVYVIAQQPHESWDGVYDNTAKEGVDINGKEAASASVNDSKSRHTKDDDNPPLLWRGGRLGGRARVKAWKSCGRAGSTRGWHAGKHILESVPWKVYEEEASVLLLHEDGSTGLDLSFATHIFLLDNIRDPALENQIISRAHRMGATGPVEVTLLLANELEEKQLSKNGVLQEGKKADDAIYLDDRMHT